METKDEITLYLMKMEQTKTTVGRPELPLTDDEFSPEEIATAKAQAKREAEVVGGYYVRPWHRVARENRIIASTKRLNS